jgi:hypothetical protein
MELIWISGAEITDKMGNPAACIEAAKVAMSQDWLESGQPPIQAGFTTRIA